MEEEDKKNKKKSHVSGITRITTRRKPCFCLSVLEAKRSEGKLTSRVLKYDQSIQKDGGGGGGGGLILIKQNTKPVQMFRANPCFSVKNQTGGSILQHTPTLT